MYNPDVAFTLYRALTQDDDQRPYTSAIASEDDAEVVDLTGEQESNEEDVHGSKDSTVSSTISKKRRQSDVDRAVNKRSKTKADQINFKDRYVHCVNCYELFDVQAEVEDDDTDASSEDECCYHPGYLEVNDDDDFWADHDEDCHGTIDTDWMRHEFPNGFLWDCCDQPGDAKGCETGPPEQGETLKHFAELNYAASKR